MRKFYVLCAALFCLSLTASAQDSTAAFDAASPASEPAAPAAPASLIPADREPWQLGALFQYQQFNVLGLQYHSYAFQADVTRYLNNWFGLEGTAITGFGHTGTGSTVDAKSLFLGGGAHVSIIDTRHLEPWAHMLVGWERLRFTQGAGFGVNSHAAFMAGAGLDYKIVEGRLYWRVQGDFLGTNVGPSLKANYSFGTGLVVNF